MKQYRSKEGSWIEREQVWRDSDESTRLASLKLIINDVAIGEPNWLLNTLAREDAIRRVQGQDRD